MCVNIYSYNYLASSSSSFTAGDFGDADSDDEGLPDLESTKADGDDEPKDVKEEEEKVGGDGKKD